MKDSSGTFHEIAILYLMNDAFFWNIPKNRGCISSDRSSTYFGGWVQLVDLKSDKILAEINSCPEKNFIELIELPSKKKTIIIFPEKSENLIEKWTKTIQFVLNRSIPSEIGTSLPESVRIFYSPQRSLELFNKFKRFGCYSMMPEVEEALFRMMRASFLATKVTVHKVD